MYKCVEHHTFSENVVKAYFLRAWDQVKDYQQVCNSSHSPCVFNPFLSLFNPFLSGLSVFRKASGPQSATGPSAPSIPEALHSHPRAQQRPHSYQLWCNGDVIIIHMAYQKTGCIEGIDFTQ